MRGVDDDDEVGDGSGQGACLVVTVGAVVDAGTNSNNDEMWLILLQGHLITRRVESRRSVTLLSFVAAVLAFALGGEVKGDGAGV